MIHIASHPLAGRTVILNENAVDELQHVVVPGVRFTVEEWFDGLRGTGGSWKDIVSLPVMIYAARQRAHGLPDDDEVVYGHIDGLGKIVHVSELGEALPGVKVISQRSTLH